MARDKSDQPWEYSLWDYLLLMATVVATLAYSAAFSPPGGDPIIRDTHYLRHLVFLCCNATAFASSLVVIVLLLLLFVLHESCGAAVWRRTLLPLRVVMALDVLSLLGACAAVTCRDAVTTVYSSLLVVAIAAYLVIQTVIASVPTDKQSDDGDDREVLGERPRKVLLLLATFAVSVTYVSGLTTPGGFWDDFSKVSVVVVILLLPERPQENGWWLMAANATVVLNLLGLLGAHAAGSGRGRETSRYVVALIVLFGGIRGGARVYAALRRQDRTLKKLCPSAA